MKYIFILFIILGCERSVDKRDASLKKIREIKFEATGLVSVNPSVIQFVESDSGEYIFLFNHLTKSLQFFDFQNGDLSLDIPIKMEGPKNLNGSTGGTLIGRDSIWMTFVPPAIGLINFEGELLFKKKIENNLVPISILIADLEKPLFQYGSRIFGSQPHFMDHHGMGSEDIKKHQLVYSYDFMEDSIQWYDVFYADDYWDQGKKMAEFSSAKRKGEIYIAPFYDHEIQVVDMNTGNVVNRKTVKSKYINRFDYVNTIPANVEEADKNRLTHDRYGTLLYDQYRDVFYRIFLPGFEPEEDYPIEDLSMLNWSRPYMGVTILDKDLNVLGEHVFDKFEVYSSSNHFVGKKGLYLSMNNLFHPDYDEDRFRYMLMELDTVD